jgi:epimerase transport system membrane fusion protein
VRELERNLAEAEAQLGDLSSNLASIELQVSETKLRILQVQRDFQREVADELAEVQGQLFEVRARLQNLEPTLARTEIRAPYTGVVLNLTVHAVGGVIAAGEKLMDIVPDGEKLVIEAQVSPLDIDRVAVGQLADVHFPAFKTNRLTRIEGRLVAVSADSIVDPKAERPAPYYLARVEVTPAGLAVLQGDNYALVAGMPADVLIKTGQRSLFDYIVEPLSDTARRAFNED